MSDDEKGEEDNEEIGRISFFNKLQREGVPPSIKQEWLKTSSQKNYMKETMNLMKNTDSYSRRVRI